MKALSIGEKVATLCCTLPWRSAAWWVSPPRRLTTPASAMLPSLIARPANSPSRSPAPFNIRQGAKTSDEARGEYSYRSEHSYQTEEPAFSSHSASSNVGRPRTLTREDEL